MNPPRYQIFLAVPGASEPESALACLAGALGAGNVAALLVREIEGKEGEEWTVAMLEALKSGVQDRGVAVILAGRPELARSLGTDGVEVADLAAYKAARNRLGSTAIVGADCGTSRHMAMELAEAGADYVGLHNSSPGGRSLVQWWSELFEVPCVALDPVEPAEAGELARLGADFVRPDDIMWTSPAKAHEVTSKTLLALEEAAR